VPFPHRTLTNQRLLKAVQAYAHQPLKLTCGMMRWKMLPSYVSFLPILPMPFSPVHSARKFSTVFGTVLPNRPMTILPAQHSVAKLDGIGRGQPAWCMTWRDRRGGCWLAWHERGPTTAGGPTFWFAIDLDVKEHLSYDEVGRSVARMSNVHSEYTL
jgi:hypothetical protein